MRKLICPNQMPLRTPRKGRILRFIHLFNRLSTFNLLIFNLLCVCVCVCVCWWLTCIWQFVTPWTVACQAPLSMEFSRQELEWLVIPFSRGSSQPTDGTWVSSTAGGFFSSEPPGKMLLRQFLKMISNAEIQWWANADMGFALMEFRGDGERERSSSNMDIIKFWDK